MVERSVRGVVLATALAAMAKRLTDISGRPQLPLESQYALMEATSLLA